MRKNLLLTLFAFIAMMSVARATVVTLQEDITTTGMNQADLVTYLGNLRDVVNELVDDHATNKTLLDELKLDLDAVRADTIMMASILDNEDNVQLSSVTSSLTGTAISASPAATLSDTTDLTLRGN